MATSLPPRPDDPTTFDTDRPRPLVGRRVRANLSTAELVEDAIRAGEGIIAAEGPLVVRTGKHTGRSPEDKFIVDEATSRDKIWWGHVNRPISEAHYDRLRARLVAYCADRDLYAQDMLIGADPVHQRRLRVYTETAWASIFARNLFRRTSATERIGFEPNFTIICVPSFQADPSTEGTRTGTAILLHLERMEIIIVGTEYAGEIKKSAFTVMNYLMPDEGVLPMHSSVNVGPRVTASCSSASAGPARPPSRRTRSAASSVMTSTAGAQRAVQLRGRLLRQDHPPLADVRAGHLPDDAPLRDRPRERGPRPARPASWTSTRSASPRTRGAPTHSTSSATPTRPG